MSDTPRKGRPPGPRVNRSHLLSPSEPGEGNLSADEDLQDAAAEEEEEAIGQAPVAPPGFPEQDGLRAGQERMQRIRAEEEERKRIEEARIANAGRTLLQDDAGAARRVTRETRKPFGSMSQKLYWPKREGFYRHWFNDLPGRIEQALQAGYTHVTDPSTKQPVSRVVGKNDRGEGFRGYLMEIPEDWWREDMATNDRVTAARIDPIRRGKPDEMKGQQGYTPQTGISWKDGDTSR
jgi:hypothetical protein